MTRRTDLRDRLHREMLGSGRTWTSEEIARGALKIVSEATRADRLVGAVLTGDPRFRKEGSTWRALSALAPRLDAHAFLLVDAPRPRGGDLPVPLSFQRYERDRANRGEIIEAHPDGSGVDQLGTLLTERMAASLNAPTVRRQLHRLERLFALPAASERMLDLGAVLRLDAEKPPDPFGRESRASAAERLHACRHVLDSVLDRHGAGTLEQLECMIEENQHGEPVDFTSFRFGPDRLDAIPSRPGIYRFLGAADELLYVGKSCDLRRRVCGYFGPLAPDHRRRARLLSEIRDLQWETTPSELEALVLEAEAIRREKPRHNRQIEVHSGGEATALEDADLVCVLCEGDASEVSVFFFRDSKGWARVRFPRDPAVLDRVGLRAIVEAWASGDLTDGAGLTPIAAPEGLLVFRYVRIFGDRIDRLRLTDFAGIDALAHALSLLIVRQRPAGEAWMIRGAADRED